MRFVDLFAGLGGFHLALARLGHECVFASEIDVALQEVYERNFGIRPAGDIRGVSAPAIPEHEVLCAGFPCQPFSKAGAQEGFECEHWGDLFAEVLRVLEHHRPAYVLLENVPNLTRHRGGATWERVVGSLRTLGYSVEHRRVSAVDLGVPQTRQRVFIVATRVGLPGIVWPESSSWPTDGIDSYLDRHPHDARKLSDQAVRSLEVWQEFLRRFPASMTLPTFPIWSAEFGATYPFEDSTPYATGAIALEAYAGAHGQPLRKLPASERLGALPSYARVKETRFPRWKTRFIRQNRALYGAHRAWIDPWLEKVRALPPSLQKLEWNAGSMKRDIWRSIVQFRASGIRVKRPTSAPTLVAMTTTQVPVIAWERRYMTPRECARLQSMHELEHLPPAAERAYKALGNAVNVDVVERIASGLLLPDLSLQATTTKARPEDRAGAAREKREMAQSTATDRINIRPGVSVLSVLRHLNYQPWYALAEFVDNSVQSYLDHKPEIQKVDGRGTPLTVRITIEAHDGGRIIVHDNAAGIHQQDYARAFRAAEVPPDRTGLSEFGMGMKSAACWFAPQWTVRTSALGEAVEKTVSFDIASIVRDSLEELTVRTKAAPRDRHFTEITLINLHKVPQGRTLSKIKTHLASMYRCYMNDGTLELFVNDEQLFFDPPDVLRAPYFETPEGKPKDWVKEIDIQLSSRKRVRGFAALRETGSTSEAGFALFRRRRLIQGSADEAWRPEYIFGRSNSFVFQRLFGELHLEGFDVSHTKDGFRWEDDEDELLERLKKEIDAKPLPLLQQARGHRSKPKREDMVDAATKAVARTAEALERGVPAVLDGISGEIKRDPAPPKQLSAAQTAAERTIDIEFRDERWRIKLQLSDDPALTQWVQVSDRVASTKVKNGVVRELGVRLALAHPFTERFAGADDQQLEPLLRIAAAIALGETVARSGGAVLAGAVRDNINELLRDGLSRA